MNSMEMHARSYALQGFSTEGKFIFLLWSFYLKLTYNSTKKRYLPGTDFCSFKLNSNDIRNTALLYMKWLSQESLYSQHTKSIYRWNFVVKGILNKFTKLLNSSSCLNTTIVKNE